MAMADVLGQQVGRLPCDCVQIDEANIPGNPTDGPLAAAAINRVLDSFAGRRAVHLCFGNYGGDTVPYGQRRAPPRFPKPPPPPTQLLGTEPQPRRGPANSARAAH